MISACIIAKNEEVLIGQCLESLKGIDEIIVCDTGSKDRTVEAAKLYTDKVFTDYTWEDSFCKARNHAKTHATGDYILSIDCDEVLHDFSKVREAVAMMEKTGALACDVTMIASDNGQTFLYPRLFKNDPRVYWVGNIHNHLSVTGSGVSEIRITHGYSPAHQLDPQRAFRILKKEVDTKGDEAIREMFYLGREYFYRNDYENSISMLDRYVELDSYMPQKAEAFLMIARCYWKLGKPEEARIAISKALIVNANFKEAIAFMAMIAGKGSGNPTWEANAKQWGNMQETATNEGVLFVRRDFDFT